MGTFSASELDAWLSAGGQVLTSSDRAARAILRAYHRSRQSEGRTAWTTPAVVPWQAFIRGEFERRSPYLRIVLNPEQERMFWQRIIASSGQPASVLGGPRRKLAGLAMEAHARICAYAPQYLDAQRRAGWHQDAAIWSGWLSEFDAACRKSSATSADRIALELPDLLDDIEQRPPLLLAGFDCLTLTERKVLDAWGEWRQLDSNSPARDIAYYRATDVSSELAACSVWCRRIVAAGQERRVLVIVQNVADLRGELERAFLRENERGADLRFELSLGISMSQTPVGRSAEMVLRWMIGILEEQELDWLIASGRTTVTERETAELASAMRIIRRRNRQRTHWNMRSFVEEVAPSAPAWAERMIAAQQRVTAVARRQQSPLEWARIAAHLLETAGWPGSQTQSSGEFQATQRFSQALETCGSLGFDGERMNWRDFLEELCATLAQMLFAPESEDPSIVIVGPAESAGLEADAVWFLGADQNAWPPRGAMNPLLPKTVQLDAGMPHATTALDWELAQTVIERLLGSAPEVRFSYSAQVEGADARPSRLAMKWAGAPKSVPDDLANLPATQPIAVEYEDKSVLPIEPTAGCSSDGSAKVHGGSSVITAQSNCPFKAFAAARLRAERWEAADVTLTPAERGELVHAVLQGVWGGAPPALHSLADLRATPDLSTIVEEHVRSAMGELPRRIREQLPARYLALEEQRLARLIVTWLEYERTRADFVVEKTELERLVNIAGLPLNLRLDRLDRLNDGTFIVIDYKTGAMTDRVWNLPRAEDLQLPIYASFGLEEGQTLGGLLLAKVRAGKDIGFSGRVADAAGTLLPDLGRTCALVKRPFEADHLMDWRDEIERLARNFLAGHAEVDPRDPPKTCERCGLHTLCRIQEREFAYPGETASQENGGA